MVALKVVLCWPAGITTLDATVTLPVLLLARFTVRSEPSEALMATVSVRGVSPSAAVAGPVRVRRGLSSSATVTVALAEAQLPMAALTCTVFEPSKSVLSGAFSSTVTGAVEFAGISTLAVTVSAALLLCSVTTWSRVEAVVRRTLACTLLAPSVTTVGAVSTSVDDSSSSTARSFTTGAMPVAVAVMVAV